MDRASDFGSEGWRFESVRAHQEIGFSPIELIVHHLQSKVQTKLEFYFLIFTVTYLLPPDSKVSFTL